jgi:hypothetical protein
MLQYMVPGTVRWLGCGVGYIDSRERPLLSRGASRRVVVEKLAHTCTRHQCGAGSCGCVCISPECAVLGALHVHPLTSAVLLAAGTRCMTARLTCGALACC